MNIFTPEPLEKLQERFKQALAISYSVVAVSEDNTNRPGTKRENTFDFEDGIRLIISRDHFDGKEVIHFSGSIDIERYQNYYKVSPTPLSVLAKMTEHFTLLYPCPMTSIQFVAFTKDKGVPHWLVPYSNLN